jgi:hypothetical protein
MPSTDRKLELKAKTLVAQTGSQPYVYVKGLSAQFLLKHSHGCYIIRAYVGPKRQSFVVVASYNSGSPC